MLRPGRERGAAAPSSSRETLPSAAIPSLSVRGRKPEPELTAGGTAAARAASPEHAHFGPPPG